MWQSTHKSEGEETKNVVKSFTLSEYKVKIPIHISLDKLISYIIISRVTIKRITKQHLGFQIIEKKNWAI